MLKIANKEVEYYDSYSRRTYKWKDVEKNCVAGRYNIIEATKEKPYIRDDDFDGEKTTAFEHHYVIDNGGCWRYDWDAIDEILKKHNIDWEYGNCD